jgi:hypothetical protein
VLGSPLITAAMGSAWCEQVREGFLRGNPRANEHALLASGPVVLAEALRELQVG